MKTTPIELSRRWINNVRVDLSHGSPVKIRMDFSLGPFYEIGNKVRLVDLDVTAGHVIGIVTDVRKEPNGLCSVVEWHDEDIIYWDPQEETCNA